MLNAHEIVGAAQAQTGLSEIGEPDISEGLGLVVDSLNREAHLRPDGEEAVKMTLIGKVMTRLLINDILEKNPAILEEEIMGPIVIVGLPRTGTSKLHRMMAASPDFQSIPLWRLISPAPIGPPGEDGEDARIAIAEQVSAQMRDNAPAFFAGHPMLPRQPDEEVWMQDLVMRGPMPCFLGRIPTYRDWQFEQDMGPWYEYLKKLLQLFQWEDGTAGKTWLIKAPDHLDRLHELAEQFPGATIVQTHRDPVTALTSIACLSVHSRRMYTDDPHPAEAGQFALKMWSEKLDAYVDQREELAGTLRFVDVPYRDIVGDITAVVETIFDAAGLELTNESRAAMRMWEAENPQHKHGKHTYSLDEVDLTEDEVRTAFSKYLDRYGKLIN